MLRFEVSLAGRRIAYLTLRSSECGVELRRAEDHFPVQQFRPVFRAVHIAWQLCRQTVAFSIEQRQRMITDRREMPFIRAPLLLTVQFDLGVAHIEHHSPRRRQKLA